MLGQISHAANSTIVRTDDTFQETGWSYPRWFVPDLADDGFYRTSENCYEREPCGVGDAATDVERVASAARAEATRSTSTLREQAPLENHLLTSLEQGRLIVAQHFQCWENRPNRKVFRPGRDDGNPISKSDFQLSLRDKLVLVDLGTQRWNRWAIIDGPSGARQRALCVTTRRKRG